METFEEYLEKMGYGWNDFDRTYEMENLIEQYANERVKKALSISDALWQSQRLHKHCRVCKAEIRNDVGDRLCAQCWSRE